MKAFPINNSAFDDEPGMDLRDYFAAKAMNEMSWQNYEISAKRCYEMADAMMKARETK